MADASQTDSPAQSLAAARLALVGGEVPAECVPGVVANLEILARHLAIVRAADAPEAVQAETLKA